MLKRFKLPFRRSAAHSAGISGAQGISGVFGRRRWVRNTVVGIAAFLVVFAVVGFFVAPPLIKHYAVKILAGQLGRPVSIQAVKVNPFAMTMSVQGLSIQEPSGSPTFASFDELLVNLEYRSIIRRAPVVKQLQLRKPYLHIVRNADSRTYNFSDLIDKFSKPDPQPTQSSPPRFSLHNIELLSGRVEFDDRPKQARHAITEINLAVPFISNLPDVVETYVQPAFSAKMNGSPIALKGRTKPFKDTLETSMDLNIDGLEIPRYMEYVPVKLGFRVASAVLDTRLAISFLQAGKQPQVLVKGDVGLSKIGVTEIDGSPLLNLAALNVPVSEIDVFGNRFDFGNISIAAPEVFLHRARDGALNWMPVKPPGAAGSTESSARSTGKTARQASEAPQRQVKLSVAQVTLKDGQLHVLDDVPQKPFRADLIGIQASLRQLAMPQAVPAQAELAFSTSHDETVKLNATLLLDPLTSEGAVEVSKVALKNYSPYYQDFLFYRIEDGSARLSTRYAFKMATDGPQVHLTGLSLSLNSFRMRKPGASEDFLKVKSAQIDDGDIDLSRAALTIGQVSTRDGSLNLIREADGAINATRIVAASKQAPSSKEAKPSGQATPWNITVSKADIERWKVAFTDMALKEPVKMVVDSLRFKASEISNQKNHKGQISLQAKLNQTGNLKAAGPVSINPVAADLKVDLNGFGLVPLQPYFTDRLNLLLSSADLMVKGGAKISLAADGALNAAFKGELGLNDFASVEKSSAEDLLKWQSLYVAGVDYTHAPRSLSIEEVALSNFYARIIIFPNGRLNLQNIAVSDQTEIAAADASTPPQRDAAEAAAATAAPAAGSVSGRGSPNAAQVEAPKTNTAQKDAVPAAATEGAKQTAPIRIAKVTLQGGDINFTDLFIKPNYSADLTEIGGAVVGLSSQLDTTADVDLRGRFAKTAPVVIKGKINPLVQNLFLDLHADVRDIELGPFTPYSGKYVGYAIEKGKMSFDVEYKVENRKLAAKNKLVLDQLTFGEKIESPTATKLPVLLAVALLKDRNGVIDVNLPISGSLDDPKFSIGGIVLRIIFNLIEKAVTAPFALIGNLLGGAGGAELSFIEFDDGRALLTEDAKNKVAKLQTALVERPGLKLEITGRVHPEKDREGLRRYRFEQQVKAQKLKDMVKQGASVPSVDQVKIEPAEYEKYLKRAYKEAKFAKPRNAIGMTKDLPVTEMEKLMLTNTQVSDDDLIQLANQRAQTAKDALTRDEKVALERVFLLAPKMDAGKADQGKASRVDFSLK